MHTPTSAASRVERERSALTRHHRNAGSAAAAARLKCPVVLAIIAGDQPKASPASHASQRFAAVTLRASPYIITPFSTETARKTTLNDATTPSQEISGSASMFKNAV